MSYLRPFAAVLIAIGIFLFFFHGVYMKRREVGRGMDTPEKRITVYVAIGIGAMFILGGTVFLIYLP